MIETSMHHISALRTLTGGVILSLALGLAHAGPKEDIEADMQAHRWTQADERLESTLEKHPDNALAHYWRAQVKLELGDAAAAREEMAAAERIEPSEKFAANHAVLERLKARLAASSDTVAPLREGNGGAVAAQARQEPQVTSVAPAAAASHHSMFFYLIIIGLVVAFLMWAVKRFGGAVNSGDLQSRRAQATTELNAAKTDLADAVAASDANASLTPEAKLANYDRVNAAKSEIAAQLASVATRSDFSETQRIIDRAHDIAAELRGEERPSERRARENQAQAERDNALAMARAQAPQGGMYGPGAVAPGGGLMRDAMLVGGGVLLADVLGNAARGETRHSGGGFGGYADSTPTQDDIDLGGSNAGGDNSWGSDGGGGMDMGGSGGGDDSF